MVNENPGGPEWGPPEVTLLECCSSRSALSGAHVSPDCFWVWNFILKGWLLRGSWLMGCLVLPGTFTFPSLVSKLSPKSILGITPVYTLSSGRNLGLRFSPVSPSPGLFYCDCDINSWYLLCTLSPIFVSRTVCVPSWWDSCDSLSYLDKTPAHRPCLLHTLRSESYWNLVWFTAWVSISSLPSFPSIMWSRWQFLVIFCRFPSLLCSLPLGSSSSKAPSTWPM